MLQQFKWRTWNTLGPRHSTELCGPGRPKTMHNLDLSTSCSSSRCSPVLLNFPFYSLPMACQQNQSSATQKITKCFIHISIYTTEQHFTCFFCTAKDINIQLWEHSYVQKKCQKYFTTVQKYFTQHHGVRYLGQEEGVCDSKGKLLF